jgi:hypothetical protein
MNKIINQVLSNLRVNGKAVPFAFLHYEGHDDTYITYQQMDADNSLSGDDDLIGYVDYYDFDIYSKGNYKSIVEQLKTDLKAHGFVWQPSRSSGDMYETDTKYYHKTLCFAILRQEEE